MKTLFTFLMVLCLAFVTQSCNLSKTAVVRDTVKTLASTTPDFYQFYVEGIGAGKLKDYDGTIRINESNPDLIISMIPGIKQDEGYFIIKPANAGTATTLSAELPSSGEISIPLGKLQPILIPQRGN